MAVGMEMVERWLIMLIVIKSIMEMVGMVSMIMMLLMILKQCFLWKVPRSWWDGEEEAGAWRGQVDNNFEKNDEDTWKAEIFGSTSQNININIPSQNLDLQLLVFHLSPNIFVFHDNRTTVKLFAGSSQRCCSTWWLSWWWCRCPRRRLRRRWSSRVVM